MASEIEIVDTHAHVYVSDFADDVTGMMQRCDEHGVARIYMPNIDADSIPQVLQMEINFPGRCFAMMGLHPCSVNESHQEQLQIIEQWFAQRSFVAVGEIGTDLYWDKTHFDAQVTCFNRQMALAREMDIPIVIHSRESLDINIKLVREMQDGGLRGVFHCFTGTVEQAREIIDLGFYLGIGGILTFKNSSLPDVVKQLPLRALVLETDAPYLTPHPHRGKRNEPAYLALIASKLAETLGLSIQDVADTTTANANSLYKY